MMFDSSPASAEAFRSQVLSEVIWALRSNDYRDNFDAARFNFDGVDRSADFKLASRAFWFDWFFRNAANLYDAYVLLADEESRRLYLHLIAFRMGGHLCVRIPLARSQFGATVR